MSSGFGDASDRTNRARCWVRSRSLLRWASSPSPPPAVCSAHRRPYLSGIQWAMGSFAPLNPRSERGPAATQPSPRLWFNRVARYTPAATGPSSGMAPIRSRRRVTSMDVERPDDTPALQALTEAGIEHSVTRHGRVRSLAEAAAARGVPPRPTPDHHRLDDGPRRHAPRRRRLGRGADPDRGRDRDRDHPARQGPLLGRGGGGAGRASSVIVKTMVVRRGPGEHLFVPGDREISWPKPGSHRRRLRG